MADEQPAVWHIECQVIPVSVTPRGRSVVDGSAVTGVVNVAADADGTSGINANIMDRSPGSLVSRRLYALDVMNF